VVGIMMLSPLAAVAACILADSPPEIVLPSPQRPVIVNASAIPKLGDVIDDPRALDFAVTVEVDSDQDLYYVVLVDLDPLEPPNILVSKLPAGTPRRTIELDYREKSGPIDPTTCHDIELIVGLGFDQNSYSPKKPPGGDRAKWRYEPRGVTCLAYDAGPLPEAGADASDAGDADGGGG
jgi:hypothetical protein